jgi:uncharacterized protein YxeA
MYTLYCVINIIITIIIIIITIIIIIIIITKERAIQLDLAEKFKQIKSNPSRKIEIKQQSGTSKDSTVFG